MKMWEVLSQKTKNFVVELQAQSSTTNCTKIKTDNETTNGDVVTNDMKQSIIWFVHVPLDSKEHFFVLRELWFYRTNMGFVP